jgi:polyhydroxyalkanoate synthesis regulator phasin
MSYTFTDDIVKERSQWARLIDLGISDPRRMMYYIESLESTINKLNDTIDHLRNEVSNLEEEIVSLKLADLYDPNDR